MDWIVGERAFWKRSTFWLALAAIVLPFGSLLLLLRLEPVRLRLEPVRVRVRARFRA